MVLSFSLFIVTGCNHNKSEEKTEKMQEKKAPTYGMENVDGMEIMKTIQEEFGIDIDSDPVDPTITEGVPKKIYSSGFENDIWYSIEVEDATGFIVVADLYTDTDNYDYLKRAIELTAPDQESADRLKTWFDSVINNDMTVEEKDEVFCEIMDCGNIEYKIDAMAFSDSRTRPGFVRVNLSIWSIPYQENVRSNH